MDSSTFQESLSISRLPVLVDFWAPWCGPCKSIAHSLQILEAEYADAIIIQRINVDESPELARSFGVMAIPTLVVFKGGQESARVIGAQSPGNLRRLFEAAIRGEKPRLKLEARDRFLRLGAGFALTALGLTLSNGLWLIPVGGLVLFSGVYDRCPIWQALALRLTALFRRG